MARTVRTNLADKNKVKRVSTTTKRKRLGVGQKVKLERKTRSGLEKRTLELLDSYNVRYEYENKNKKLEYRKPETHHKYLPDLIIDGVIYELKGYMDANTRLKMECVVRCNPNQRLVMVFMKDQPIRKGAKTTYTQWADKVGIEWMMITEFEQYIKQRYKKK